MKFLQKILLLFAVIALSVTRANAISEHVYTSQYGELSSTSFCDMVHDSYGYLWIATENGLNQFDGYEFTTYFKNESDPTSLTSSFIASIYEDSKQRLWIGTVMGLMLFNREDNSFTHVPLYNGQAEAVCSIHQILEMQDGTIWLGTGGSGLFQLKDNNGSLSGELVDTKQLIMRATVLFEQSDGTRYVGCERGGLFKCQNGIFTPILTSDNELAIDVTSITETDNHEILVSRFDDGLNIIEGKESDTPHLKNISKLKSIKHLHKLANKPNTILASVDGNGVYTIEADKLTIEKGIHGIDLTTDLSGAKCHKVIEDKKGNLYLGIYHMGIVTINTNNIFEYFGPKSHTLDLIGNQSVLCIEYSKNGKLYVGTDGDGLYEVDIKRRKSRKISLIDDKQVDNYNAITQVFEDSKGRLWISTYNSGLHLLSADRKSQHRVALPKECTKKISRVIENNAGDIFVTTLGSGVYILDKDNLNPTHIEQTHVSWLNAATKCKNGDILIGSAEGILSIRNVNSHFEYKTLDIENMNNVTALFCDSQDRIWIGTREELHIWNGNELITLNDMLNTSAINPQAIIEDNNDNIWISTIKDLYCIAPNNTLLAYYSNESTQSNEFSKAATIDSKGALYFGGIDGVIYLQKKQLDNLSNNLPTLYISDIKSNKRRLGNTINRREVNLNADETYISIHLSTFSLLEASKINYYYRVTSSTSSEFIALDKGDNKINLANLPYGDTKLEIFASSDNDKSDIIELTINVASPWYLTWWAKGILIFIIISAISYIIILYIAHLKNENKYNLLQSHEEANREKLNFFINISHEINNPLTMIMSPLDMLLKSKSSNKKSLEMIHRNATKIANIISLLSDIQKIDNGIIKLRFKRVNVASIITKVIDDYQFNADLKKQKITFQDKCPNIEICLDALYFEKIISNLLSNAIKYTQNGGSIRIYTKLTEESQLRIVVQDDGPGIEDEAFTMIFNRFYQSKRYNKSTGVGLNFTKSIVELHGGNIVAENRKEISGARFIVTLPTNIEPSEESVSEAVDNTDNSLLEPNTNEPAQELAVSNRPSIMIVDKEIDTIKFLSELLSKWYDTVECSNPKEALNTCKQRHIELIIMNNPLSSDEHTNLISAIRKLKQTALVPIIVLSNTDSTEDRLFCLKNGVDMYIPKPFNNEILFSSISNLITKSKVIHREQRIEYHYDKNIDKTEVSSDDEKFTETMMSIINKNLSNSEFNSNSLSDELTMSRMQLHRKMKKLYNMTAHELLRDIRMKEAARLLTEGKITISEVAYMVGFNNVSHFSTSFKQAYGVTPREYTNSNDTKC